MSEYCIDRGGVRLFARVDGVNHRIAPTVVFAHALGTDHRLWDAIIPLLSDHLRLIRYDMRGHGQSDVPPPPYSMGALISDAEALLDHFDAKNAVFVGLSLGGMVAQGLAVKRLDLVRALVLSNTAAKIATQAIWQQRIEAVQTGGVEAIAAATLQRWFGRKTRTTPAAALWQARLLATPPAGYIGCASAIAGTDFITPTSGLRLPALGIAGSEDGSTPADMVRETIDLIPGSRFKLIRGAGHLACIDAPDVYAETLTAFLQDIGHI